MVSGKRQKCQYKRILDHSFLFTIQNYTLCHRKNWFFHLCVSFKIVTWKSVVSPINRNIEKKHHS